MDFDEPKEPKQNIRLMSLETNRYLLKADQLSIGYRRRNKNIPVLQDINLYVYPGELICILGPNGVGKSTLLRTLAGVQKPLNGDVWLEGRSRTAVNHKFLAEKISLVLTDPLPPSQLTVEELVALGRYPHTNWRGKLGQKDWSTIRDALQQTKLTSLRHKPIHQLSDGQQQKTMIARALAQEGSLIILDEPTSFLDINNQWSIMTLLQSIARNTQRAILMATHQLELALQTADQLWVINHKGRIIEGLPEDLALQGVIAETFFEKDVQFDLSTGKFNFHQQAVDSVNVIGGGESLYWTQTALKRKGFKINNTSNMIITIGSKDNQTIWKVNENVYYSIKSLLSGLKP